MKDSINNKTFEFLDMMKSPSPFLEKDMKKIRPLLLPNNQ